LRDFFAGFEDNEFFAGDESKDGVGRGLGVLDEVAVDSERTTVQALQFNHVKIPPRSLIGRDGAVNREAEAVGGADEIKEGSANAAAVQADEV